MRMKYFILAILSLLLIGVVVILLIFKPRTSPATAMVAETAPQHAVTSAVAQGGFIRTGLNLSAAEISRARDKQHLVEVVGFEQVQHDPAFIFKRADPAQQIYLRYDPSVIETRKIGEQVQFTVPALGVDYQLQIESMQAIDRDIMRWEGRVLGRAGESQGQRFSVMQSQTDRYSIIQVQSDQGMISAEIKNGVGVISNTPINHDHDALDTHAEIEH